jgi:hypothetical protein
VIAIFLPKCSECGLQGEYKSKDIPPHRLAIKDGWHIKGRGWVCNPCYRKLHGMEIEADARKKRTKSLLDSLKKTIKDRAGA